MSDAVPQGKKKRGFFRTIFRWIFRLFLLLLIVALLLAIPLFHVPERLGIIPSKADRYLDDIPYRTEADLMLDAAERQGLQKTGITLAVFQVKGKEETVAYAILDDAQGFSFVRGEDPVIGTLSRLLSGDIDEEINLRLIGLEYRNAEGKTLIKISAPVDAVRSVASGQMDNAAFIQSVEGTIDYPLFIREQMRELQELLGS